MKSNRLLFSIVLIGFVSLGLHQTWQVFLEGASSSAKTSGDLPGFSPGADTIIVPDDYATIQAAIDAATAGDTIMVRTGTYIESLTLDTPVTLTAENYDEDDPTNNQTIVDGGNAGAAIYIPTGVTPQPTIRGFVIRNAIDGIRAYSEFTVEYSYFTDTKDLIDYEKGSGGVARHNVFFAARDDALDLDDQTKPLIIEDNRILYCTEDGIEIRLHSLSAPSQLIDITIRNNEIIGSGQDGIQFIDYPKDPQDTNRRFYIHNNLFANNQMAAIGLMPNEETIEDYSGADIVEAIRVYSNTFYGNDYGISGGDNLVAFNNIIANSVALGVSKVQGDAGDNSVVAHTLFHGNGTDVTQSELGVGNLFGQDPLFVGPPNPGPDGQFGTLDDDFSDLVLQLGSPAIDAGVAQYSAVDGELVPPMPIPFNGTAPDLGWRECDQQPPTPTATTTPLPTATNTSLPTASNTPALTPSDTPAPSATSSPSPTPTNTSLPPGPTNTPQATGTSAPTATATNTGTSTATATAATAVATATPTGTPAPHCKIFLPLVLAHSPSAAVEKPAVQGEDLETTTRESWHAKQELSELPLPASATRSWASRAMTPVASSRRARRRSPTR